MDPHEKEKDEIPPPWGYPKYMLFDPDSYFDQDRED
jgi:hypothetical protein